MNRRSIFRSFDPDNLMNAACGVVVFAASTVLGKDLAFSLKRLFSTSAF